ncbi:MAG: HWE histidine kinase domain-containing protein [Paracoccaceae bacterium]
MTQVQACEDQQSLFKLTTDLMRHLSGYDRTLIYRFDSENNGEVLEEAKRFSMDSFLGLRFPSWDIPAQARAIMAKLPLRLIQDTELPTLRLQAATKSAPPLDITLAASRGVSEIHMEYLRNMGSRATMTLSVVVEEKLWGIISFHHLSPRVPPPALREILTNLVSIFSGKLLALQQKSTLDKISALDRGLLAKSDVEVRLEKLLLSVAPTILETIGANGVAAFTGSKVLTYGTTPGDTVLEELSKLAASSDGVVAIECLATRFPGRKEELGRSAGALIVGVLPDRAICLFRNEIVREVAWAGDPEKKVAHVSGRMRLTPRGSFTTFLEKVSGRCEAWSEEDIFLIGHIRTLLHSTERQIMIDTLNRQQALMIGELNHRVRNILALVRSVSRQARRRYGSLNSYANAIENRIRALAASHDLSGGSATAPVSLVDLVMLEFEPFEHAAQQRVRLDGPELFIRPEVAPIFSLVMHELTTNAVKYGALSNFDGEIQISIEKRESDVEIFWQEKGGPAAVAPNEFGFGMAMIQQAVPHELGGTANVEFLPSGLQVKFVIGHRHFDTETTDFPPPLRSSLASSRQHDLSSVEVHGPALLLEDNFIIAKEMADLLGDLGAQPIEVFSSADDALQYLQDERPRFAILDVNLGSDQTSEAVAMRLLELKLPFLFVTGYGDSAVLSEQLAQVPRLTKPVSAEELAERLIKLVDG